LDKIMSPHLANKVALVTGSTSGLGLAIARHLAQAGCRIILNGLGDPNAIEELRKELAATHGVEVIYLGADLTQPGEISQLMATCLEKYGAIDILVNNAGMQFVAPLHEYPTEKWDTILALNLSAAFHTTKAALPAMRERGWGRIINIASAHGLVASPFKSAYVAAKHGLVGLSKVTALETAEDGITCNAICPGFIRTAVVDKQIEEQARVTGIPEHRVIQEVILTKHPNKTFVDVEHVADSVLFLCSPAGASITGSALSIDGGWTAC